MKKIEDLTINESEYNLENGKKGKVAVFLYSGSGDPIKILHNAIKSYVGDNQYYEFIDSSFSNPWMRVVVSNINDMKQESFDQYIKRRDRKDKLKKLNENG
jgi:spermidine synthase